ncbi:MAG: D-alanyl-D-alanine carboxypeptidase [Acidimicrobiales bacterium]|jgi:D-alanyl-D-alanine carboxypeptidase (penicillin-binding protein 5/6)
MDDEGAIPPVMTGPREADDGTAPSAKPRSQLSAAKARRRRLYWRRRATVLAALAVVLSGVGWLFSGPGSPRLITSSDPRPVPVHLPSLVSIVRAVTRFPGTLEPLPIPSAGQSAVYVQGIGLLGASPDEQPAPMASVTKVMAAVVVLEDHPLGHGSGPTFTMTAADHAAWIRAVEAGDSSLEVVAGERLTERQLLEGLMIPSACNIADYLAVWDAGSIAAFVRKMNAMAAALGLAHTHYADASGLSPYSRSTAIDQAVLGAYAMSVPGMVSIVDHAVVEFPTGPVGGYNPAIGQDGVIGLKSGFTDAAQICLVTAARRSVGGHSVLVVSSTLGQPSSLEWAAEIDLQLLDAATSDLRSRPLLRAYQPVARVVAGWSRERPVAVVTVPVTVVGWAGLPVRTVVKASIPVKPARGRGWKSGTPVADVEVLTPAGVQSVTPAKLSLFLSAAPPGWTPPPAARLSAAAGS